MGACAAKQGGEEDARARDLNRRISMALKSEEKESSGTIKLLLLGTGNSGKSTVMKQIKLLFADKFTKADREEVLVNMVQNIIVSLHIVLEAIRDILGDGSLGAFLQEFPSEAPNVKGNITKADSSAEHRARSVTTRLSIKKRNTLKENAADGGASSLDREMDPNNYPLVEALVSFLKTPPESLASEVSLRVAIQQSADEGKIADNCENLADDTPLFKEEKIPVVDLLERIWKDSAVQYLYAHHKGEVSARLEADVQYMMNGIRRMAEPGFLPSNDDIMRTRKRTVGAHTMDFAMDERPFRVTDVGGQRSERKRWVSHFDGIDALLFIVGLDGYAQVLTEDGKTNRLDEALEVFGDMVVCPFFTSTSFLLFLNKKDLLEEMIADENGRQLDYWDPNFAGPKFDYDAACSHIQDRFVACHADSVGIATKKSAKLGVPKNTSAPAEVYTHFTCATDTGQMSFVLDACKMIFLSSHLSETGMTLWDEDDEDGE